MKRITLIGALMLATFLVSDVVNVVKAQWVVIDPGHGGPQASKYGCNGWGYNQNAGTYGPVDSLTEQWVNLHVSLQLRDLLQIEVNDVQLTRDHDTTNIRYWDRVNTANYGGPFGGPADAFVSIHHNSYMSQQGTEVWWSAIPKADSGYTREYGDSTLAMKIQFKILDKWGYKDRCAYARSPGTPTCSSAYCCNYCCFKISNDPPEWDCCWDTLNFEHRYQIYFVLRNTISSAALSEASSLQDTLEEELFNVGDTHINEEGEAIFRAVYSYLINSGIAIVKNSYSGGNAGDLVVSKWDWWEDECFDTDTVDSPHFACWLGGMFGEAYCLQAITLQWIGGHQRTFHHWAHLDNLGYEVETHDDPLWKFEVPYFEEDYHIYVAYFTGGYSAQVVSPNGWEIWHVGEQRDIVWNVSIGADSTTMVYIYLDRNGGNDGYPEYLGNWSAKLTTSFTWTVTDPYSTHCRIKVVAYDRAGNSAWDVSNYDFIISESGNNDPVIDTSLRCKYPYDECIDCIQYGEQVTIEILAHDPDGDSIFYQWFCMHGRFAENGQNTITTAENFVTYVAPTKGKAQSPALRSVFDSEVAQTRGEPSGSKTNGGEGEKALFDDYISVEVMDVRGGHSFTVGWPELHDQEYSCLCGDANDDLIIDLGDLLWLTAYLYRGGAPPVNPTERGDVNNDCLIDLGDVLYLTSYLYHGGPYPECCWFPPEQ